MTWTSSRTALCLSLVVNAIITFNTVYLELAPGEYVQRHGPVSPEVQCGVERVWVDSASMML